MTSSPVFAAITPKAINPDTSNWFVYEYPSPDKVAGTPLDASWVLDAPAGKHGYLNHTDGNKFVFEDGTPVSFFGTNFSYSLIYSDYESAVLYAEQLSQAGINMVRLFFDNGSYNGLWGRKAKISRIFNKNAMDKLCFLISEFKKRGIYVSLNLSTSKPIFEDDTYSDIENLTSPYFYYVDELIETQKEFISTVFNYYNPYTGTCLKDEPAIASIQFRNENTIATAIDSLLKSDVYNAQLKQMFNQWLVEKYGTRDAILQAWAKRAGEHNTNVPLKEFEDPQLGTVEIPSYDIRESSLYTNERKIYTNMFLDEIQRSYFNELSDYARSIGVKCLISGSTAWDSRGKDRINFHSNLFTDYIDTHDYYSNSTGTSYAAGVRRHDSPASILQKSDLGYLGNCMAKNVFGMPHVISEWNDLSPNMYRSESLLLVTAYSALHGMQPIGYAWQLADSDSSTENFVKTPFGYNNPETWGALPAAAMMFYRGDIKEADTGYYYQRFKYNEMFSNTFQYINPNLGKIGLIGKTGFVFGDIYYDESYNDNDVLYLANQAESSGTPYVSITGELSTDLQNKIFKLNTERSQAISGFIKDIQIELNDVTFNINNPFATLYLTSLSDQPLYMCDKMLLTAVGDTRNTGMSLSTSDGGKTIVNGGTAPILCEPITGSVIIKTTDDISVYPLKTTGERKGTQKTIIRTREGYARFNLGATDGSMHYEIVRNTSYHVKPPQVQLGSLQVDNIFADVDTDNTYKKAIERLALNNYIGAESDNYFFPDHTITKKDFIKMLMKALTLDRIIWHDSAKEYFNDIHPSEDGFGELASAYLGGIITIDSTKNVYPNAPLTRGEAMRYAARALARSSRICSPPDDFDMQQFGDYDDCVSDDDFEYYRIIMGLGYISSVDGDIEPNSPLTRAEGANIIYNILWK